ncbi:unnamed protein product [Rotaria sordida]|uniref:Uncharacterized protein n=1 Tax=Rotaria sordida TaxID=392033 RepID=A0A813R8C2_9BILA|nr:unnamed protein product [Rotaria sordida]CAF0781844.1 unnamed protein product [Rotaria sordida]CAF1185654.1 unnamed protein product [Rotaria sordida]CAF3634560.1 unnamed protein product [Rotaria sordida]CAF3713852.1 unnamed protein product [Rotaria sordida]
MRLLWFYTLALVLIFAFAFQHVNGDHHKKGGGKKDMSPHIGGQADHPAGGHGRNPSLSPHRDSSRSRSSSGHRSDGSSHKGHKHGKGGKHKHDGKHKHKKHGGKKHHRSG